MVFILRRGPRIRTWACVLRNLSSACRLNARSQIDWAVQYQAHYSDVIMSVMASQMAGEFPAQKANNAENVSIWWRHHVKAELSHYHSGWTPFHLCMKTPLYVQYEVVRISSKCRWRIYRTSCKCRWSIHRFVYQGNIVEHLGSYVK